MIITCKNICHRCVMLLAAVADDDVDDDIFIRFISVTTAYCFVNQNK